MHRCLSERLGAFLRALTIGKRRYWHTGARRGPCGPRVLQMIGGRLGAEVAEDWGRPVVLEADADAAAAADADRDGAASRQRAARGDAARGRGAFAVAARRGLARLLGLAGARHALAADLVRARPALERTDAILAAGHRLQHFGRRLLVRHRHLGM